MDFSWLPLVFGLCLLAFVMFVCRTVNAACGVPRWNGALFFFALCCLAMLLDFALTMIFASANFYERTEYERYASRGDWGERAVTYLIQLTIALALAVRFRRRQRFARCRAGGRTRACAKCPVKRRAQCKQRDVVQIQTSAYTRSELRL